MGMKRADLIGISLNMSKLNRAWLRKNKEGEIFLDLTMTRLHSNKRWGLTHVIRQYPGHEELTQLKAAKLVNEVIGHGTDWSLMTREIALDIHAEKKKRMAIQAASGQKVELRHTKRGV